MSDSHLLDSCLSPVAGGRVGVTPAGPRHPNTFLPFSVQSYMDRFQYATFQHLQPKDTAQRLMSTARLIPFSMPTGIPYFPGNGKYISPPPQAVRSPKKPL